MTSSQQEAGRGTAAATALLASLGLPPSPRSSRQPMSTRWPRRRISSKSTSTPTNASGNHIYFFRDQGNSPETDPAAHLLLIKHDQWHDGSGGTDSTTTTTTTTVAQATHAR